MYFVLVQSSINWKLIFFFHFILGKNISYAYGGIHFRTFRFVIQTSRGKTYFLISFVTNILYLFFNAFTFYYVFCFTNNELELTIHNLYSSIKILWSCVLSAQSKILAQVIYSFVTLLKAKVFYSYWIAQLNLVQDVVRC